MRVTSRGLLALICYLWKGSVVATVNRLRLLSSFEGTIVVSVRSENWSESKKQNDEVRGSGATGFPSPIPVRPLVELTPIFRQPACEDACYVFYSKVVT